MDPTASASRSAARARPEGAMGAPEGRAAPASAPAPAASRSQRHGTDGAPPARAPGSSSSAAAALPPRNASAFSEIEEVPLRGASSLRSDDASLRSDSGYFSAHSEPGAIERASRIQRDDRPPLGRGAADPSAAGQPAAGGESVPDPGPQGLRQRATAALRRRAQAVLSRESSLKIREQAAQAGAAALGGAVALGRTAVAPLAVAHSRIASALDMGTEVFRLPKAALGHLVHQGVAVGFTTAVREVAAEAMIAMLRQAPPGALLGIEVGMGVVNMSLQALRQVREQRNPDEAARGFHALSPEQWDAKTPEEKAGLRKEQRLHSDRVASLQVVSLMVNVGFAVHGVMRGDNSFAAAGIASEAKTIAYGVMRDGIQSKFGMVKIEGDSHGVSGNHLAGAALFYGGGMVATSYAWSTLPPMTLPPGVTAGNVRDVLRGVPVPGLSLQDAVGATAKMIGVKATLNTVLEAADWFSVTEQEAQQAGTRQVLAPHIKGNDFGRMKDHVPGRVAVINAANSVGDLMGFLTKNLPPDVGALLSNGAMGVWVAANYKSIAGTWQAEGAVRGAEDQRRPAPRGTEAA